MLFGFREDIMGFEQFLAFIKSAFDNSYKLTAAVALSAAVLFLNPFKIVELLHLAAWVASNLTVLGLVLIGCVSYTIVMLADHTVKHIAKGGRTAIQHWQKEMAKLDQIRQQSEQATQMIAGLSNDERTLIARIWASGERKLLLPRPLTLCEFLANKGVLTETKLKTGYSYEISDHISRILNDVPWILLPLECLEISCLTANNPQKAELCRRLRETLESAVRSMDDKKRQRFMKYYPWNLELSTDDLAELDRVRGTVNLQISDNRTMNNVN